MRAILFSAILFSIASLQAETAALNPPPLKPDAAADPAAPANLWTVIGRWHVKHPEWEGDIDLLADGRFSWSNGDGGRWTLAAERGSPLLILRWDLWGTESASMITGDYFRGKTAKGQIDLTRLAKVQPSARATGAPAVEFRTWSQGEPPLKLIPATEGFCALTTVAGGFAGGGEAVSVYIDDSDGIWYLNGRSQQEGVTATCIIVRYKGLGQAVSPSAAAPR